MGWFSRRGVNFGGELVLDENSGLTLFTPRASFGTIGGIEAENHEESENRTQIQT